MPFATELLSLGSWVIQVLHGAYNADQGRSTEGQIICFHQNSVDIVGCWVSMSPVLYLPVYLSACLCNI